MKWNRVLERNGYKIEQSAVEYDPFLLLAQQTAQRGEPASHVSMTTTNGADFGQLKVTAMVSIGCPQDERSINLAAEIAFRKVLELTNDASSHLGLQPLPVFQDEP